MSAEKNPDNTSSCRTTVRLPDAILRRAKQQAAAEGRTLTSLIEEGLELVLGQGPRSSRARPKLPVSRARGGVLPGVRLDRSAALEDLMDKP